MPSPWPCLSAFNADLSLAKLLRFLERHRRLDTGNAQSMHRPLDGLRIEGQAVAQVLVLVLIASPSDVLAFDNHTQEVAAVAGQVALAECAILTDQFRPEVGRDVPQIVAPLHTAIDRHIHDGKSPRSKSASRLRTHSLCRSSSSGVLASTAPSAHRFAVLIRFIYSPGISRVIARPR